VRLAALGLLAGALFLTAFAVLISTTSFHLGFDDAEHVTAALHWRDHLRLETGGPFVRVPLWQVLLGTLFAWLPPGLAVALFQCAVVLVAIALAVRHLARLPEPRPLPLLAAAPVFAFALSPQVLLYGRHPVNEPWVGLLAMGVLYLGTGSARGRAFGMGLLCGAAAMTKLMAGALLVPAAVFAWRGKPRERRVGALALLSLGAAVAAGPFAALHAVQRPGAPLDDTSAFTLSRYTPRQWVALGPAAARQRAGMAEFREHLGSDPAGYLAGAAGRLGLWLARPATADFALFVPGFPTAAVGAWEHAVFFALLGLAALGTTAASAPIWIFLVAVALACAFPPHMPFVPKLIPVFPALLLAPQGVLRLLRPRRSISASTSEVAGRSSVWRER
jgi:hypothetical protein